MSDIGAVASQIGTLDDHLRYHASDILVEDLNLKEFQSHGLIRNRRKEAEGHLVQKLVTILKELTQTPSIPGSYPVSDIGVPFFGTSVIGIS